MLPVISLGLRTRAIACAFGLGAVFVTIGPIHAEGDPHAGRAEERRAADDAIHAAGPRDTTNPVHAGEPRDTTNPVHAGEPRDTIDVSVLTFGPGDHPFSKFGHDGILIVDRERGTSLVYNYGTFSFHSYWLIPQFLLGKYRYWLSVSPLASVVATYAAENRSVLRQRLALSPREKVDLAAFLAWNARDENKYYEYDYYRDNCATRIRDVIDRATGGALRPAMTLPGAQTWRAHTERLTADDLAVYLGLDFAMGAFIDRPVSLWREMFLPDKLRETLAETMIESPGSPPHKLVVSEEVLAASDRPVPLNTPPEWTLRFLALGVGIGLILTALGAATRRGARSARAWLGVWLGVLGLTTGLLGTLLAALWAFTNHEVAFRNENLLQASPLALLLAWAGARLALGKAGGPAAAHAIARLLVVSSIVGLALKMLPAFSQKNGPFIALLLPLWTGAALATWLMPRGGGSRPNAAASSAEKSVT